MTTQSSLLRVILNRATTPATCEAGEDKLWPEGSWPKGADLMKPPYPVSATAAAHYQDRLGVSSAQGLPSSPPWDSESMRQRLCTFSCGHSPTPTTLHKYTHIHTPLHHSSFSLEPCQPLPGSCSFPTPSWDPRLTLAEARKSSIHLSTRGLFRADLSHPEGLGMQHALLLLLL